MSKQKPMRRVQLSRLLGDFWTIPNMLSLIRLILIIPITYLILVGGSLVWLFSLIALAVMTDWFDGRVARWLQTVSVWGKVLDPLADKVGAAMVVLALVVRDVEPTLPAWFLALIVVRDLCIVLGGVVLAKRTGHVAMSTWTGKVAVSMLALTILATLLRADPPVLTFCVWVTSGLMVYSFLLYLVRFVRLMQAGELPEMEEVSPERPEQAGAEEEATAVQQRAETLG